MSKKSEKNEKFKSKIGGQALIEGVMMRGIDTSAMACRMPDGSIDVETWKIRNGKTAPWYLKTPFIRGCFNFAISLIDGMKCTMKSAEKQADADDDDDDDEPSKFEQWLSKTRPYKWLESKIEGENGKEVMNTIMLVVCVVVMILCVCAFKFFHGRNIPMIMLRSTTRKIKLVPQRGWKRICLRTFSTVSSSSAS